MKRTFRVSLLALALLAPSAEALAWGDTGHMVVAQVAFGRLNPKARARVNELLVPAPAMPDDRGLVYFCEHTYTPVTIANWMDDMRDSSLHDDLRGWHFVNRNPLVVGTGFTPDIEEVETDVLKQVEWALDKLEDSRADDDRYTPEDKRDAELVGFLYHLVGDLHQPLHTCTRYTKSRPRGDRGGNSFEIVVPGTNVRNLHSYWDGAGGLFGFRNVRRPLDAQGARSIRDFANAVTTAFPAERHAAEWSKRKPSEWVAESNKLAREFAFVAVQEDSTPSNSYRDRTQDESRKRLAFAGYRLAEVLNATLGKP